MAAGEETPKPKMTDTSPASEGIAPSAQLSLSLAELVMTSIAKDDSCFYFSDGVLTAAHLRLVILTLISFSRPGSTTKFPTADDDEAFGG